MLLGHCYISQTYLPIVICAKQVGMNDVNPPALWTSSKILQNSKDFWQQKQSGTGDWEEGVFSFNIQSGTYPWFLLMVFLL